MTEPTQPVTRTTVGGGAVQPGPVPPAEWAQCETDLSGALGTGPNAETGVPTRTPMVIGLAAIAVIVALCVGFVAGLAAA